MSTDASLNDEEIEHYARLTLHEKNLSEDPLKLAEIVRALRQVFRSTYHAVALDIDGTITSSGSLEVSADASREIGRVLDAGAYVLLVTGGGRKSVQSVATQLLEEDKSGSTRNRRLFAMTGNGCQFHAVSPGGDLSTIEVAHTLKESLGKRFVDLRSQAQERFGDEFDIQDKTAGIRLVAKEPGLTVADPPDLRGWLRYEWSTKLGVPIRVVKGHWGQKRTYDISVADKDRALAWFYTEFDFVDVPILRVGDEGGQAGNDYSLLDSPYGFSVGVLSQSPFRCFPVFDIRQERRLFGTEATAHLLSHLDWSARLTIPSHLVEGLAQEYRRVLHEVRQHSEVSLLRTAHWWEELARGKLPPGFIEETVRSSFSRVFDQKSGAVRLSEQEWHSLPETRVTSFLTEKENQPEGSTSPRLLRSMYLDEGVCLRGPRYYIGLSTSPSVAQLQIVGDELACTTRLVVEELASLQEAPSGLDWKTSLAVLDYARNCALSLYTSVFQAAILSTNSQPYWRRQLRQFDSYVSALLSLYYAHLLLDRATYRESLTDLNRSSEALTELRGASSLLYDFLESNDVEPGKIVKKWREVDHPGQIIAAVRDAWGDVESLLRSGKPICVLGLMNGGVELPFTLRFLARGVTGARLKIGHVGGVSYYGGEVASGVMAHDSREVLEQVIPGPERLEDILPHGSEAILMDDNVVTGRTLELARDRLRALGVRVPFSICVRYPTEGRIPQMEMRKHGGVDPGALGKDIRGLIAPAPYSRIFTSRAGQYVDVLKQFDQSRSRVVRYLKKNGIVSAEGDS